jgi:hypothetical protein
MERRHVSRTMALLAGAQGLAGEVTAADPTEPKAVRAGSLADSHIETADGAPLFYRDYGSGRPVVFAAPWALNTSASATRWAARRSSATFLAMLVARWPEPF